MRKIIAVAAIFGAAAFVYISIDVWQECRATNSFFYCLRLVAH